MDSIYGPRYYGDDATFRSSLTQEIQQRFRRFVPAGKVLDIGAGTGDFMKVAVDHGYSVEGTETSSTAYDICRAQGLPVRLGDMRLLDFRPRSFDAVTMWDVLEHLSEPAQYLERIHQVLVDGGYLVIKTPNITSTVYRAASILLLMKGTADIMLQYPAHVLYFDHRSLVSILRRAGFEADNVFRVGSMRMSYTKGLASGVMNTLAQCGHAKNLIVYARKPPAIG